MIPLATILKAAQTWKFKGDTNDETAMRAFCADCVDKGAKLLIEGKPVTRAAVLEVETPADVTADAPATFGDVTADVTARSVQAAAGSATDAQRIAHLESLVRKLDARLAGGAPGGIPVNNPTELAVRSQAEIVYQERKRQGLAVFSTFEAADAWHGACIDYLGAHGHPDVRRSVDGDIRKRNAEKLAKYGIIDRDGFTKRTYATFPAAAGGALTHTTFIPDLIKNINTFGIARKLAKYTPMNDETTVVPKHNGGFLTVRYPAENDASTSQRNTYTLEKLVAKTGIVAVKMSRQIVQDARIDLGLDVADDITRAFARQEDLAYISGDGTSTYAGMVGILQRFTTGGLTLATAAGMQVGGATTSDHTIPQLNATMARAQDYARGPGACWLTSYVNQSSLFDRLFYGLGGVTMRESQIYGYVPHAMGFPIICTNTMNSTNDVAANTVDALFGDFARGSMIGDRMGLEIESDASVGFLDNALWIRGVCRHDINVHDVGTTTTAGPIVGLYQTA